VIQSAGILSRTIQQWTKACDDANQAWISVNAANLQVGSIRGLLHQAAAEKSPANGGWLPGLEMSQSANLSDEERCTIRALREKQHAAFELMEEVRASSSRIAASHAASILNNEETEAQRSLQRSQAQAFSEHQQAAQEHSTAARSIKRALEDHSQHAAGLVQSGKGSKGRAPTARVQSRTPRPSPTTPIKRPRADQSWKSQPSESPEPATTQHGGWQDYEDVDWWNLHPEGTVSEEELKADGLLSVSPHLG
jgi:hypothetical protein